MGAPLATCTNCALPVLAEFYFCPNCGKQLRVKSITVSVGRQVGLYLLTLFMPPVGIPFAIRYIKQPNKKTKTVGIIILSIVILSIGFTLYGYALFIQYFYGMYTKLGSTQMLGY